MSRRYKSKTEDDMCAEVVKKRRAKSAEQALASLMRECAKAEKSTGDAFRLLTRWEVPREQHEGVVKQLIELRFIDNHRFAEAYLRDKLNLSGWGTQRIRLELGRKGVEREIIDEVVGGLDRDTMRERLLGVMLKRRRSVKYKDNWDLKGKLLRYGASLGYEYSMLNDVIAEVTQQDDDICSEHFF